MDIVSLHYDLFVKLLEKKKTFMLVTKYGLPVCLFRFTYEIAPVFVLMEQLTLKKMREIIGWPNGDGDGLFSPGK